MKEQNEETSRKKKTKFSLYLYIKRYRFVRIFSRIHRILVFLIQKKKKNKGKMVLVTHNVKIVYCKCTYEQSLYIVVQSKGSIINETNLKKREICSIT